MLNDISRRFCLAGLYHSNPHTSFLPDRLPVRLIACSYVDAETFLRKAAEDIRQFNCPQSNLVTTGDLK